MSEIATGMASAGGLFVGMLILLEAGRRIRQRRYALHGEGAGAGHGAIEGAVFGLMGLLVAFTFSGAASRFDIRRQPIVEEANAISTAYLRLDLLPSAPRRPLQQHFREYVDARLALYRTIPDSAKVQTALARAAFLQAQIWRQAVAGVREAPVPTR